MDEARGLPGREAERSGRAVKTGARTKQLRKIWLRDDKTCWICHQPVALEDASRDHVVPQSKGGTNRLTNLKTAHKACNHRRGDNDEPAYLPKKKNRSAVSHAAINAETNLEFEVVNIRKGWGQPRRLRPRGPVMEHITNKNAREVLSTEDKIAMQKRTEP